MVNYKLKMVLYPHSDDCFDSIKTEPEDVLRSPLSYPDNEPQRVKRLSDQIENRESKLLLENQAQSPAKRREMTLQRLADKELDNWKIELVQYRDDSNNYQFNAIKFINPNRNSNKLNSNKLNSNKFSFAVPDGLFGKNLEPGNSFSIPLTPKVTLFDKIQNSSRSNTATPTRPNTKIETEQSVTGNTKYIKHSELDSEMKSNLYNIICDVKNFIGSVIIARALHLNLDLNDAKNYLMFFQKMSNQEFLTPEPNFNDQNAALKIGHLMNGDGSGFAGIGSIIPKLGIYGIKENQSINYELQFPLIKLPFQDIELAISKFIWEQSPAKKEALSNLVMNKISDAVQYQNIMKLQLQHKTPNPSPARQQEQQAAASNEGRLR